MKANSLTPGIMALAVLVFTAGCSMLPGGVTCNPPYIEYGSECCLDQNNNSICDSDEGTVQNQTTGGNETECGEEGETIAIYPGVVCCEGLEQIAPKDSEIVGVSICTGNCGNGICDSATESYYNCPEDCEEEDDCVSEGGAIPVIASPPECCAGLDLIDPKAGIIGISGYCTAKCGDGYCNSSIESATNCPADCPAEVEVQADPCEDVQCSSGYYCSNGSCVESLTFTIIPTIQVQMYSFCGDDICSASENSSANCCTDCGCPSGSYCSNNTCIAGTPPLFFPIYVVATAYFPPTEKLISDGDPSSVKPPRIYGNKLVYAEIESSMFYEGKMYDISADSLQVIPHPETINNPDIWGGRIVWSNYGVPGEGDEIYYYDFAGGTQGYINPRPTYQYGPKIWNNAIIWEEQVEDGSDYGGKAIYFFWIPNAEERKIFHNKDKTINGYDLWGANVIISTFDCSDGVPCPYELWKYDISTKDTTRLFYNDDGKEIHSPSIWDERIAYVNGNDNYAHIYVYDMGTGLTQKITSVNSEKVGTAIYDDKIVWSDKRNGNWDIYMYDMSDAEETQITSDDDDDWRPDIYGDAVAWIRGSYSSSPRDVYLYKIT